MAREVVKAGLFCIFLVSLPALSGCVSLPPEVKAELLEPLAGQPNNFSSEARDSHSSETAGKGS
ncbi:MAG: hypothetical protein DIZ77_11345 [endosymbiont of Seepiophila jonesi]|uniref:Uncharacterized protein n=1 Tax=endosymbiont of Lamellibrachia luymesi TaxID=2200907 RepID=A0A370E3B8_9GAMM|nr:MAG: hypothetical protein DIZ77_11345 [endosymbiont of Seepiophila jonesi]RDH93571.1 MAG: hypothetical protein DIZ79_00045 [endosymbiont of Lamellibrachia luymesi]